MADGPADSPSPAPTQYDIEELVPLAYEELRRLAAYFLRMENPGHTLAPTAIVHEAYLRLANQDKLQCTTKQHFLAIASKMIRRILVDHARSKGRIKRGRDWKRVTLSGAAPMTGSSEVELLALNDCLDQLSELGPRLTEVVEMRYFGGLSIEETAEALAVSKRTVNNDWRFARAWLRKALAQEASGEWYQDPEADADAAEAAG